MGASARSSAGVPTWASAGAEPNSSTAAQAEASRRAERIIGGSRSVRFGRKLERRDPGAGLNPCHVRGSSRQEASAGGLHLEQLDGEQQGGVRRQVVAAHPAVA